METVLDPKRVEEIFDACLYKDEYMFDGLNHQLTRVEGVVLTANFDYLHLAEHRLEIENMLREPPGGFNRFSEEGGLSFLEACCDKNGNQWTGLHQVTDKLFMLGMGIGKVEYLLPRKFWSVLPGNMPYIVISH